MLRGGRDSSGHSSNDSLIAKGADTLSYTDYRVTSATIKGGSRTYTYDLDDGFVLNDGKRTYQWTSFGQLKEVYQVSAPALETLAATGTFAPEIPGIAPKVQYAESEARASFEFDSTGSRSLQNLVRTFSDFSEAACVTRYLGSYELEEHSTRTPQDVVATVKTLHRHSLGSALLTEECPDDTPRGTTASKVRLGVVLTDHIGSTEMIVRAEWDHSSATWQVASGEMEGERQSFNAWGERRDAATWGALKTAHDGTQHTSGADYDRGFTGHEMLDDFGIIHMNGRIYDPEIGRFLSADPYVQVPEYSQNFNRYSYVLNNPLSYTDSSGLVIDWIVAACVAVYNAVVTYGAAVATAYASGGLVAAAGAAIGGLLAPGLSTMILTGAGGGAITGGMVASVAAQLAISAYSIGSTLDAGGSVGDALLGVAVNFVTAGISSGGTPTGEGGLHAVGEAAGEAWKTANSVAGYAKATALTVKHVAGHAVLGGASRAALGGRFQDGFLSAGVSTLMMDTGMGSMFEGEGAAGLLGRTAVSAVVGGTAAAVGGGKFANGAMTAAWQHLLNEEIPSRIQPDVVAKAQLDGKALTTEEFLAKYKPDDQMHKTDAVAWMGMAEDVRKSLVEAGHNKYYSCLYTNKKVIYSENPSYQEFVDAMRTFRGGVFTHAWTSRYGRDVFY